MRRIAFILASGCVVACASTPEPTTAWVRPDLTAELYAVDASACAEEAAAARADGGDVRVNGQSDYARAGSSSASGANDLAPVQSAGAEVNTNMYDVAAVARYNAAVAARNQAAARERATAACMSARGYYQITLTPEQEARVAAAPEGGAERAQVLREIAATH